MPSRAQLRKQLLRMWDEDPHCHWCGELITLAGREENNLTAATATLDHLYSRLDPRRKQPNRTGEKRYLLACHSCNQRRSKVELTLLNAEKERRRVLSALGIQTIFE